MLTGSGTPAGTVSFYIDGNMTAFDTETVDANGTAVSTGISTLNAIGRTVSAVFNPTSSFVGSNASASFSIGQADATVAYTGYSGGTYDGSQHTRTVTVTGVGNDGTLFTTSLSGTSDSSSITGSGNDQVRHTAIDLSTASGIAEASTVVAREEPDILVNMAGVQYFGPAESQSFEDMHNSYMVNLVAPAALCRACLSAMKRRNAGQIANVGSIFGSIPLAHFAAYSSAKAGLRALGEALRRELAGTEISVTYVAPRAVRTPMLTPEIQQYADLTRMNIDPPEIISKRIVTAIKERKKDVYIGFPERLFVRLNAVMPRLVDAAVAGNDRKAMKLFAA